MSHMNIIDARAMSLAHELRHNADRVLARAKRVSDASDPEEIVRLARETNALYAELVERVNVYNGALGRAISGAELGDRCEMAGHDIHRDGSCTRCGLEDHQLPGYIGRLEQRAVMFDD